MINLTILIPSVPGRINILLPRLLQTLHQQIDQRNDVEIIVLYDNKKTSLGVKRNNLIKLAQGNFITFIDDDDLVADNYIELIMDKINNYPTADCIVFNSKYYENNQYICECKYGIELEYNHVVSSTALWTGKPAHTMIWARDIIQSTLFPDINHGEDYDWVALAWPKIKHQVRIDEALYFYYFSTEHSEFRHLRG